MGDGISYKEWHIPFKCYELTLQEAYDSLLQVGAGKNDIPFVIKLVENPKLTIPGLEFFHGAVELQQHDLIHIVLGRGLLEMDEAFTIGFTMGSTKKVTTTEEKLFALISKHLYPQEYKFSDDAIAVFKDAVRLGAISGCASLDSADLSAMLDMKLATVRKMLGLETSLLSAYYQIEKQRYPDSVASQRLLDDC